MRHKEKVTWMQEWVAKHGMKLVLEGEVGLGRECVGVSLNDKYPEYYWYDDDGERADLNGDVWVPSDAYHKGPYVSVLGRGVRAESQLFEWLRWFADNNFVVESGSTGLVLDRDDGVAFIQKLLGHDRFVRLVRNPGRVLSL